MDQLTVGYVSGAIAAVITVLQFILPNLIVLILVGLLSETHTAVTWSVVGRALGNSHWPIFLRSDTVASEHVARPINLVSWVRPVALVIIGIAAVVTPMGLFEALVPLKQTESVSFQYLPDRGAMGLGTPLRSLLGYSRFCGSSLVPAQCPATKTEVIVKTDANWINTSIPNDDYDVRVPAVLAELYQSGLKLLPSSVSSFFDIQMRQYQFASRGNMGNKTYLVDSYRTLTSLILNERIEPVEGLVVDTQDAKIGFRNHTVPHDLLYGAEWNEEVLFWEPETVCVDTNITYEVHVPAEGQQYLATEDGFLVDQGGFVNINKTNPWLDGWYGDTQKDPKLYQRAYRAAWTMNVLNMYYFNVSKPGTNRSAYLTSEIGKRFPVNNTLYVTDKDKVVIPSSYGGYSSLVDPPSSFAYPNGTVVMYNSTFPPIWSNPWKITTSNYSGSTRGDAIQDLCRGWLTGDKANITNIAISTGIVLGMAQSLNGSGMMLQMADTWWSRPVYSCASAVKASIKTVSFRYNATFGEGMNKLQVVDIRDKVYANESQYPVWGVEKANMTISRLNPLWGLISPELEKSVNLSTSRSPRLYLPGTLPCQYSLPIDDLAEDDFWGPGRAPCNLLASTYYPASSTSGSSYTGEGNIALYMKWKELNKSLAGTAKILNLIWTDLAANAMVGTRSWNSGRDLLPPNLQSRRKRDLGENKDDDIDLAVSNEGLVAVHPVYRRIRYQWVYAIPAFVCLALTVTICLAAAAFSLSGRGSVARVRHFMWNLSAGRLLASILYPDHNDSGSKTRFWIREVGSKPVSILSKNDTPVTTRLDKTDTSYRDHSSGSGSTHSVYANSTHVESPVPVYTSNGYMRVQVQEPKDDVNDRVTELPYRS